MLTVNGRQAVECLGRFRRENIAAVPQFEDGQPLQGRVRVHHPVRRDAEPLIRGFLGSCLVMIDLGEVLRAGRPPVGIEVAGLRGGSTGVTARDLACSRRGHGT